MNESFCEEYVSEQRVEVDSSPGLRLAATVLLVPSVTTILVCYFYFYFNYKKYEITKVRNIFLLTLFAFGLLILVINYCLRDIIGSINYSCRAYSLLLSAQITLILQVAWIRLFSLVWRVNYNKMLIKQTYLALTKGDLKQNPGSVRFVQLRSNKNNKKQGYYTDVFESEASGSFFADNKNQSVVINNPVVYRFGVIRDKVLAFILFDVLRWKSQKEYPLNIRIAGVFASPSFASFLLSVLIVFSMIVFLSVDLHYLPFDRDCVNCFNTPTIAASRVLLAISLLFIIYGMIRVFRIYDSFGIRREVLVLGSSFLVFQAVVILLTTAASDIERDGTFDFSLITVMYATVVSFYIFPYQIWLAKKMSESNVAIKEDSELLRKLLDNADGKKAFSLYLACSLSLENLFFYDAATHWKKIYPTLAPIVQQTAADDLFAQFLSNEAFLSINVSDKCKTDIREDLQNGLKESTFDEAIATVWIHMVDDIFPRFKKTAYFKAAQNEVQNV